MPGRRRPRLGPRLRPGPGRAQRQRAGAAGEARAVVVGPVGPVGPVPFVARQEAGGAGARRRLSGGAGGAIAVEEGGEVQQQQSPQPQADHVRGAQRTDAPDPTADRVACSSHRPRRMLLSQTGGVSTAAPIPRRPFPRWPHGARSPERLSPTPAPTAPSLTPPPPPLVAGGHGVVQYVSAHGAVHGLPAGLRHLHLRLLRRCLLQTHRRAREELHGAGRLQRVRNAVAVRYHFFAARRCRCV